MSDVRRTGPVHEVSQTAYNEVKRQLEEAQVRISELTAQVGGEGGLPVSEQVISLNEQIEALKGDLQNARDLVESQASELSALSTTVADLQRELANYRTPGVAMSQTPVGQPGQPREMQEVGPAPTGEVGTTSPAQQEAPDGFGTPG